MYLSSQKNKIIKPKLRFKEFTDEWQVKTLGDLVTFKNGKPHEQDIDSEGKFVVINSKFISTSGRVKKYVNKQIEPVNKDDIVMVMSDVPNGKAIAKCFLVDESSKYTLNQRICALIATGNNSSRFIFYKVDRNNYYLGFDNGVSQTNLRKDEVLDCPILAPNPAEQEKIAQFMGGGRRQIGLYPEWGYCYA